MIIDAIVDDKDFWKSDTATETYESIEELKYLQEYEDGGIFILDESNEREKNYTRMQTLFKRSRHNNLSFFIIDQDYYELSKRTIRANGTIYHIFKPNTYRVVQNLGQDKASMDMTLNESIIQTFSC